MLKEVECDDDSENTQRSNNLWIGVRHSWYLKDETSTRSVRRIAPFLRKKNMLFLSVFMLCKISPPNSNNIHKTKRNPTKYGNFLLANHMPNRWITVKIKKKADRKEIKFLIAQHTSDAYYWHLLCLRATWIKWQANKYVANNANT